MVCPRTIAASVALAMIRVSPSSTSLRPNGVAKPMLTWPVIVAVMVAGPPPVDIGLAVRLFSLMKARTMLSVDEPRVEKAMVWPLVSFSVLMR